MQAEGFDRAIGEMLAVGVKWREAARVDIPQVERRLAIHDPLGHEFAGAAGVGDAR